MMPVWAVGLAIGAMMLAWLFRAILRSHFTCQGPCGKIDKSVQHRSDGARVCDFCEAMRDFVRFHRHDVTTWDRDIARKQYYQSIEDRLN